MDEIDFEDLIRKTFSIYPKHLRLLEKINKDNVSIALRSVLDFIMYRQEKKMQKERIKQFNSGLVIVSLGLIFFIFSYTTEDFLASWLSLGCGIVLAVYGLISGVLIR